jgi:ribonucleoside-diphosphate reductase alpha chain
MMKYVSRFCNGTNPYDLGKPGKWGTRDVAITKMDGTVVFQQKNVEAPTDWSDLAVQVVAQKYFRGKINSDGTPAEGRETSIRQLIDRVVDTIAGWAGFASSNFSSQPIGVALPPAASGVAPTYCPDAPPGFEVQVQYFEMDAVGLRYVEPTHVYIHKRPIGSKFFRDQVYFDSRESWEAWKNDLKWLLVNQYLCFNSPVWFNFGIEEWPQGSACFLVRMEDRVEGPDGILEATTTEGKIFRGGSGSGINLSRLRSSKEWLSGGGKPSGPMSFAKTLDTQAGVIKSGGKSRRAAKMLLMDVDHPDIREFVHCKANEERIAKTLIAAGYPADMDGAAYEHAFHQNSNLSVRVNNLFMEKVDQNGFWDLISRTEHHLKDKPMSGNMLGGIGRVLERLQAKELMREIAQQAWECGDPGVQFADTVNEWHTCADEEPIFTCNPCAEYLHLDNTSCNLASLNLKKFFASVDDIESQWRVDGFIAATRALTIAMDVIVSGARYPTETIQRMSNRYRTLGVGYANLGGMLMSMGLPYNSDAARGIASAITSLMTASVYAMSAQLAEHLGPFEAWDINKRSFTEVMQKHARAHTLIITQTGDRDTLWEEGNEMWARVITGCRTTGIRNAQATVLAPTGTIAYFMDCETTGIEPELGLVKYKTLSGGGTLALPNPSLAENLMNLGISALEANGMADLIAGGASPRHIMSEEWGEVFRTSFPPTGDPDFALPWTAHVDMMAAVQPFISGAISKTVNMPNQATVEDVMGAYKYAWESGLKAIAIYRDGSKGVQAVSTTKTADGANAPGASVDQARLDVVDKAMQEATSRIAQLEKLLSTAGVSVRRKPPQEVNHVRVRFEIETHKGYLFVGFFEDGQPCEIFVTLSKTGSALQGFTNAFCICFSMLLQYGVPLDKLVQQFQDTEFEPKGFIRDDTDVRICRSVVDYIVRKVQAVADRSGRYHLAELADFPDTEPTPSSPPSTTTSTTNNTTNLVVSNTPYVNTPALRRSGKVCMRCGSFDVLVVGKCYICRVCGSEDGGCFG